MKYGNLKYILNQINVKDEEIKYKFYLLLMIEMINCVQIVSFANIKLYLDENSFIFDIINARDNSE